MRFLAFDKIPDNRRTVINPMQVSQVYEDGEGRAVIIVGGEKLPVSIPRDEAVRLIETALGMA
jgi:hypothetical protein